MNFEWYIVNLRFYVVRKMIHGNHGKIIYSPESIILHSVSQSLGDNSFEKIRMKLLNQIRLFWKHASGIQLITITLYWIFFYLPGGFLKWIYFKLR